MFRLALWQLKALECPSVTNGYELDVGLDAWQIGLNHQDKSSQNFTTNSTSVRIN